MRWLAQILPVLLALACQSPDAPLAPTPTPLPATRAATVLPSSTPAEPLLLPTQSPTRTIEASPSSTTTVLATTPLTTTKPSPSPVPTSQGDFADVVAVSVSGNPGSYQFSVTVQSPDTGCEEFADWWEVLDTEGNLLYRRVLLHSHVSEQPFTRSGGPVKVTSSQTVLVRAHMSTTGYGGVAFTGSPSGGFQATSLSAPFASQVEQQLPLPTGCAF